MDNSEYKIVYIFVSDHTFFIFYRLDINEPVFFLYHRIILIRIVLAYTCTSVFI
jgi:hypothetical protein